MNPQTKKSLTIAVAVIALAVAVVLLLTRSGAEEAQLPTEYTTHAVDLVSGEEMTLTVKMAEAAPFKNPKTGEATVFPWFYCVSCNQKFVPDLDKGPDGRPRIPMIKMCPTCGESGGPWMPADETEANPKGNAPLPKLPA